MNDKILKLYNATKDDNAKNVYYQSAESFANALKTDKRFKDDIYYSGLDKQFNTPKEFDSAFGLDQPTVYQDANGKDIIATPNANPEYSRTTTPTGEPAFYLDLTERVDKLPTNTVVGNRNTGQTLQDMVGMLDMANPTSAMSQVAQYNAEHGVKDPNALDFVKAYANLNPLSAPAMQSAEQVGQGFKDIANTFRGDESRLSHLADDIANRYDEQIILGQNKGYTPQQIQQLQADKQLAVNEVMSNPDKYASVVNRLLGGLSGGAKAVIGGIGLAVPQAYGFTAGLNAAEGLGNTLKTDFIDKTAQTLMSPASSIARGLGYNGTENDDATHLLELADLALMFAAHKSYIKGKDYIGLKKSGVLDYEKPNANGDITNVTAQRPFRIQRHLKNLLSNATKEDPTKFNTEDLLPVIEQTNKVAELYNSDPKKWSKNHLVTELAKGNERANSLLLNKLGDLSKEQLLKLPSMGYENPKMFADVLREKSVQEPQHTEKFNDVAEILDPTPEPIAEPTQVELPQEEVPTDGNTITSNANIDEVPDVLPTVEQPTEPQPTDGRLALQGQFENPYDENIAHDKIHAEKIDGVIKYFVDDSQGNPQPYPTKLVPDDVKAQAEYHFAEPTTRDFKAKVTLPDDSVIDTDVVETTDRDNKRVYEYLDENGELVKINKSLIDEIKVEQPKTEEPNLPKRQLITIKGSFKSADGETNHKEIFAETTDKGVSYFTKNAKGEYEPYQSVLVPERIRKSQEKPKNRDIRANVTLPDDSVSEMDVMESTDGLGKKTYYILDENADFKKISPKLVEEIKEPVEEVVAEPIEANTKVAVKGSFKDPNNEKVKHKEIYGDKTENGTKYYTKDKEGNYNPYPAKLVPEEVHKQFEEPTIREFNGNVTLPTDEVVKTKVYENTDGLGNKTYEYLDSENNKIKILPELIEEIPNEEVTQSTDNQGSYIPNELQDKGIENGVPTKSTPTTEGGSVGENVKKKYQQSVKEYGDEDIKITPTGKKQVGRYVIVGANDVTPSHNPFNFSENEGYPTQNGKNINDRDYKGNLNNQNHVMSGANSFDGRALQDVPIVTKDGIVVDGNGRTMMSQLSVNLKSDSKYYEDFDLKAKKYGFTPEQIESSKSLESPRIVFELNEIPKYSNETLSEYNKTDKKAKSKNEILWELNRTIPNQLFDNIVSLVDEGETLSDFYNNAQATKRTFNLLEKGGIIPKNEVPKYYDKGLLTNDGKQFIENLILSKTLDPKMLELLDVDGMKQFKQPIIKSTKALSENSGLPNRFNLLDNISNAIELINKVKLSGQTLDDVYHQLDLFEDRKYDLTDYAVADILLNGKQLDLKKLLDQVNRIGHEEVNNQNIFQEEKAFEKESGIQDVYKKILKINDKETELRNSSTKKAQVSGGIEPSSTGNVKESSENGGTQEVKKKGKYQQKAEAEKLKAKESIKRIGKGGTLQSGGLQGIGDLSQAVYHLMKLGVYNALDILETLKDNWKDDPEKMAMLSKFKEVYNNTKKLFESKIDKSEFSDNAELKELNPLDEKELETISKLGYDTSPTSTKELVGTLESIKDLNTFKSKAEKLVKEYKADNLETVEVALKHKFAEQVKELDAKSNEEIKSLKDKSVEKIKAIKDNHTANYNKLVINTRGKIKEVKDLLDTKKDVIKAVNDEFLEHTKAEGLKHTPNQLSTLINSIANVTGAKTPKGSESASSRLYSQANKILSDSKYRKAFDDFKQSVSDLNKIAKGEVPSNISELAQSLKKSIKILGSNLTKAERIKFAKTIGDINSLIADLKKAKEPIRVGQDKQTGTYKSANQKWFEDNKARIDNLTNEVESLSKQAESKVMLDMINDEEYQNTGLQQAFKEVQDSDMPDSAKIQEMKSYANAYDILNGLNKINGNTKIISYAELKEYLDDPKKWNDIALDNSKAKAQEKRDFLESKVKESQELTKEVTKDLQTTKEQRALLDYFNNLDLSKVSAKNLVELNQLYNNIRATEEVIGGEKLKEQIIGDTKAKEIADSPKQSIGRVWESVKKNVFRNGKINSNLHTSQLIDQVSKNKVVVDLMHSMGIGKFNEGYVRSENETSEVKKKVFDVSEIQRLNKLAKSKFGMSRENLNRFMAVISEARQYHKSESPNVAFNEFKLEIAKSIDRLEQGNRDSENLDEAKFLQEVYDKYFDGSTTPQEFEDKIKADGKEEIFDEVKNMAQRFKETGQYEKQRDFYRAFDGTDIKEIENYLPTSVRSLDQVKSANGVTADLLGNDISENSNIKSQRARSTFERKRLTNDESKVINLDFANVVEQGIEQMIYDYHTLPSRVQIYSFLDQSVKDNTHIFGSMELRNKIAQQLEATNQQRRGGIFSLEKEFDNTVAKGTNKFLTPIIMNRALSKFYAVVQQTVAPIVRGLIEAGTIDVQSIAKAFKENNIPDFEKSLTSLRLKQHTYEGTNAHSDQAKISDYFDKSKAQKVWETLGKPSAVVLDAVVGQSDYYSAKVLYDIAYRDYVKKQGYNANNLQSIPQEIRDKAVIHADKFVANIQGRNVNADASATQRSINQSETKRLFQKVIAPFNQFGYNKYNELLRNIGRRKYLDKEGKAEVDRKLLGMAGEAVLYSALTVGLGQYIYRQMNDSILEAMGYGKEVKAVNKEDDAKKQHLIERIGAKAVSDFILQGTGLPQSIFEYGVDKALGKELYSTHLPDMMGSYNAYSVKNDLKLLEDIKQSINPHKTISVTLADGRKVERVVPIHIPPKELAVKRALLGGKLINFVTPIMPLASDVSKFTNKASRVIDKRAKGRTYDNVKDAKNDLKDQYKDELKTKEQ